MILWLALIIWVYGCSLMMNLQPIPSQLSLQPTPLPSWKQTIIVMFPIIFFIGLRSAGADTHAYISSYLGYETGLSSIFSADTWQNSEWLFTIFGKTIKTFISSDFHIYLFIIALITGLSLCHGFHLYSDYFFDSVALFMITGTFTWMINGIRQFLVVAILFANYRLLVERKWWYYIPLIIILSRIHQSSIIMLPVYFVVQGEPWNKKTMSILLGSIVLIFFSAYALKLMDDAMSFVHYSKYEGQSTFLTEGDNGSNPIRTLIMAVTPVLAWFKAKEIHELRSPVVNILVNMSILACAFSLIANVTSGIYAGRIPIYFTIYNLLLLPFLIRKVYPKNIGQPLYYGMYAAYLFLFFYLGTIYYVSDWLHLYLP